MVEFLFNKKMKSSWFQSIHSRPSEQIEEALKRIKQMGLTTQMDLSYFLGKPQGAISKVLNKDGSMKMPFRLSLARLAGMPYKRMYNTEDMNPHLEEILAFIQALDDRVYDYLYGLYVGGYNSGSWDEVEQFLRYLKERLSPLTYSKLLESGRMVYTPDYKEWCGKMSEENISQQVHLVVTRILCHLIDEEFIQLKQKMVEAKEALVDKEVLDLSNYITVDGKPLSGTEVRIVADFVRSLRSNRK